MAFGLNFGLIPVVNRLLLLEFCLNPHQKVSKGTQSFELAVLTKALF